jgi:hypothetical protein
MWRSTAAEASGNLVKTDLVGRGFWIVPTDKMTTLETLYAELADIERQQQDKTLPHSDQQLLDQAWEATTNQIDELERYIEDCEEEGWRDAREVIDEDSPRFPSYPLVPPSVTLQSGVNREGKLMVQMPDGTWVPGPPLTITIPPRHTSPSYVPPPPRPGPYPVCNCDGDGRCDYCLELDAWNALQDDREGCKHCSGCTYCTKSGGYDGTDEV